MPQLELILRFLFSLFLAWMVLSPPSRRTRFLKSGLCLSAVCAGFGLADAMLGGSGGMAPALFLLVIAGFILAVSFPGGRGLELDAGERLLSSAAVCFFAGRGIILVSLLITLIHVIVDSLNGRWGEHQEEQAERADELSAQPGATSLVIRAQDLRGIIGKVESVLERFQVKTREMRINQDQKEKELQITLSVFLPVEKEKERIVSALQHIEGVIQLALK